MTAKILHFPKDHHVSRAVPPGQDGFACSLSAIAAGQVRSVAQLEVLLGRLEALGKSLLRIDDPGSASRDLLQVGARQIAILIAQAREALRELHNHQAWIQAGLASHSN